MTNHTTSEEGFSIVELLITLSVAGMAVVIFTTMYASASRLSDITSDFLAANEIAYRKLQSYENKEFANIPVSSTTTTPVETFDSEVPTSIPGPRSGKVFVDAQSETLKYVFIRITYGQPGQQRVVEYGDFIQAGGLGR